MPTTLLRGSTGASSRTAASDSSLSVSWTPTCSGSPASATTVASSAGMPSSSTSPVTTPYCGSSPVVNLAMRTCGAYRRGPPPAVPTLVGVETGERAADVVLDEAAWTARREAHERRVDSWVRPHLDRRRAGVAHPVEDFLFTYYSLRPAALRRWHPGYGVALAGGRAYAGLKGYAVTGPGVAAVTEHHVRRQRPVLTAVRTLLAATARRPAQLS